MLVLTRKLQETITIGQDITITVLRRKGNSIQIGIEAPRQMRVMRGEIQARDERGDAGSGEGESPTNEGTASYASVGGPGDGMSRAVRRVVSRRCAPRLHRDCAAGVSTAPARAVPIAASF